MFIWLQSSPLLLTYPLPDRVVRKDRKRIKFIRGISYPTPLDGYFELMHYYCSALRFNVILSTTLQSWSEANLE